MNRWAPIYRAPISFAPELWHREYRGFWQAWLRGKKVVAVLRIGDWWQP